MFERLRSVDELTDLILPIKLDEELIVVELRRDYTKLAYLSKKGRLTCFRIPLDILIRVNEDCASEFDDNFS